MCTVGPKVAGEDAYRAERQVQSARLALALTEMYEHSKREFDEAVERYATGELDCRQAWASRKLWHELVGDLETGFRLLIASRSIPVPVKRLVEARIEADILAGPRPSLRAVGHPETLLEMAEDVGLDASHARALAIAAGEHLVCGKLRAMSEELLDDALRGEAHRFAQELQEDAARRMRLVGEDVKRTVDEAVEDFIRRYEIEAGVPLSAA